MKVHTHQGNISTELEAALGKRCNSNLFKVFLAKNKTNVLIAAISDKTVLAFTNLLYYYQKHQLCINSKLVLESFQPVIQQHTEIKERRLLCGRVN